MRWPRSAGNNPVSMSGSPTNLAILWKCFGKCVYRVRTAALRTAESSAIPERQGKPEDLPVVVDPADAIFTLRVGTRPRLVVSEVAPGIAVFAVILAYGAPLP